MASLASPVIGVVGAIEYMFIRESDLNCHLIPGLLAAAVGYGVYSAILQGVLSRNLQLP